ncbi:hypothetical protein MMC22_001071 [Lobaria immixta]|nr:hypothetical protein [Lobaria immixta]
MSRDELFKISEEKPFLFAQETGENSTELNVSATHQRPRKLFGQVHSTHLALIVLYTVASALIIWWNNHHCVNPESRWGPSQASKMSVNDSLVLTDVAIKFSPEIYMKMHESPYVGPPSLKIDGAWSDLMGNMTIRVTESELARNGQMSVRLPNGGYLAWLGVFYQLHCVKMLRQLNYRDHYHPNLTTKEQRDWQVHADHCIELLRASAMCHPDISSLTTFVWDKSEKPMLSTERPLHRCVDWEVGWSGRVYKISSGQWGRDRSYAESAPTQEG